MNDPSPPHSTLLSNLPSVQTFKNVPRLINATSQVCVAAINPTQRYHAVINNEIVLGYRDGLTVPRRHLKEPITGATHHTFTADHFAEPAYQIAAVTLRVHVGEVGASFKGRPRKGSHQTKNLESPRRHTNLSFSVQSDASLSDFHDELESAFPLPGTPSMLHGPDAVDRNPLSGRHHFSSRVVTYPEIIAVRHDTSNRAVYVSPTVA